MSQVQQLKVLAQKENGIATQLYDQPLDHDTPLEILQIVDGNQLSLWKKVFSPRPIVTDEYPISNFKWYWDSGTALSHAGTFPTKLPHPDDPVVLFSNASGVKNHKITEDGWLEINSGGGNGRIYLELYRIPAFVENKDIAAKFMRNLILMTTFKMSPNAANLSIKFGNHGTTGFLYASKKNFGGFGQAAAPDEVSSAFEGNHDASKANGKEKHYPYPSNFDLEAGKEYKLFTSYISEQTSNVMNVNTWIMFDTATEKKWYHVMNDRLFKNDSEWQSLMKQLKNSATDKPQCLAGPAMVDCYHVWLRANKKMIAVKDIFLGTVN